MLSFTLWYVTQQVKEVDIRERVVCNWAAGSSWDAGVRDVPGSDDWEGVAVMVFRWGAMSLRVSEIIEARRGRLVYRDETGMRKTATKRAVRTDPERPSTPRRHAMAR